MTINYCEGWFHAKKCASGPLTVDTARRAFEKRTLHTAIIGQPEAPTAFVEFNRDYVGVGFLDARLREYLSYTFEEVSPGRLFLCTATHREFAGDTDEVLDGTTYFFKQDGRVIVETQNLLTGEKSTSESKTDVAGNWEPYPKFGEYESLVRIER